MKNTLNYWKNGEIENFELSITVSPTVAIFLTVRYTLRLNKGVSASVTCQILSNSCHSRPIPKTIISPYC